MKNSISFIKNYTNKFINFFNKINLLKLVKIISRFYQIRKVRESILCIKVGGSMTNTSNSARDIRRLKKYKNPIKKINLKEIIYKVIEGCNAA